MLNNNIEGVRLRSGKAVGQLEVAESNPTDNSELLNRTLHNIVIQELPLSIKLESNTNKKPDTKISELEMAKSNFNLSIAFKIIPEYDGKSSDGLDRFLKCCDIVYKSLNESGQSEFSEFVIAKLTDKAFSLVKYKQYENWEDIKKDLQLNFYEQKSIGHLNSEMMNIRQKEKESVREYSERLEDLLQKLNNACIASEGEEGSKIINSMNSKLALTSFRNGLYDREIRTVVKAWDFKNLKDAVTRALEEELYANQRKVGEGNGSSKLQHQGRNNNNSHQMKCQICFKIGHTSRYCFRRYGSNPQSNTVPSNSRNFTNSNFQKPQQYNAGNNSYFPSGSNTVASKLNQNSSNGMNNFDNQFRNRGNFDNQFRNRSNFVNVKSMQLNADDINPTNEPDMNLKPNMGNLDGHEQYQDSARVQEL